MSPEVQTAIVAGVFSLAVAGLGLVGRRRSTSAMVVRRSLTRQEKLEDYVFRLRRQVIAAGRRPHPWPHELRYLNKDDPDEGETGDDDEP